MSYEREKGRLPKEMPPKQPGYDIESDDPISGITRRIEVKGKYGIFRDTASVEMSPRQFSDAFNNRDDSIEYWLYVVDNDQVLPIKWTGRSTYFLFYASEWATEATDPAPVNLDIKREYEELDEEKSTVFEEYKDMLEEEQDEEADDNLLK